MNGTVILNLSPSLLFSLSLLAKMKTLAEGAGGERRERLRKLRLARETAQQRAGKTKRGSPLLFIGRDGRRRDEEETRVDRTSKPTPPPLLPFPFPAAKLRCVRVRTGERR